MKKALNRIYRTIMLLLVVLCIALIVLRLFGVSVICVKGDSMEPTYRSGELHLISKADEYERSDVVVVQLDDVTILKRIVAVEGDTLEIYHHCVFVNDEIVAPYIKGENWNNLGEYDTHQTIEQGSVFLLGDQRNTSGDSRHFGSIKRERIIGRIIW